MRAVDVAHVGEQHTEVDRSAGCTCGPAGIDGHAEGIDGIVDASCGEGGRAHARSSVRPGGLQREVPGVVADGLPEIVDDGDGEIEGPVPLASDHLLDERCRRRQPLGGPGEAFVEAAIREASAPASLVGQQHAREREQGRARDLRRHPDSAPIGTCLHHRGSDGVDLALADEALVELTVGAEQAGEGIEARAASERWIELRCGLDLGGIEHRRQLDCGPSQVRAEARVELLGAGQRGGVHRRDDLDVGIQRGELLDRPCGEPVVEVTIGVVDEDHGLGLVEHQTRVELEKLADGAHHPELGVTTWRRLSDRHQLPRSEVLADHLECRSRATRLVLADDDHERVLPHGASQAVLDRA